MSSEGSPLLLNTSMMMSRTCQSQHSPLGQRLSYTVLKPLPLNIWEYKKRLLTKTSLTGKSIPEWCTAESLKTPLLLRTQQFSKCLIQKQSFRKRSFSFSGPAKWHLVLSKSYHTGLYTLSKMPYLQDPEEQGAVILLGQNTALNAFTVEQS